MKIKKTIYVYIIDGGDPEVCTSREEAIEAVYDEIAYFAERWGEDDEEVIEARNEFERALEANDTWFGTYIGDHSIGFYVREIELEI